MTVLPVYRTIHLKGLMIVIEKGKVKWLIIFEPLGGGIVYLYYGFLQRVKTLEWSSLTLW